jgi:DNA topoisomerase-3
MSELKNRDGPTSGQLHREAAEHGAVDRSAFEMLLGGLAREGLVEVRADSFVKDGKTIRFRRVHLTRTGRLAGARAVDAVRVVKSTPVVGSKTKRKTAGPGEARPRGPASPLPASALDADQARLFERLRAWRLAEARKRRIPAFRILSDRVLVAICRARPADEDELLDVQGMGPALVRKHGRAVLSLVNPR